MCVYNVPCLHPYVAGVGYSTLPMTPAKEIPD